MNGLHATLYTYVGALHACGFVSCKSHLSTIGSGDEITYLWARTVWNPWMLTNIYGLRTNSFYVNNNTSYRMRNALDATVCIRGSLHACGIVCCKSYISLDNLGWGQNYIPYSDNIWGRKLSRIRAKYDLRRENSCRLLTRTPHPKFRGENFHE